MLISRRRLIAGAAATIPLASTDSSHTAPAQPVPGAGPFWTLAQQPTIPLLQPSPPPTAADFASPKTFEQYLFTRFMTRTKVAEVVLTDEANQPFQSMLDEASRAAFEGQRAGKIDRTRDYRVIPIPIRRNLIIRNFDTMTDLLVVAAWEEGKRITKEVFGRVREFICPMYPFCTV